MSAQLDASTAKGRVQVRVGTVIPAVVGIRLVCGKRMSLAEVHNASGGQGACYALCYVRSGRPGATILGWGGQEGSELVRTCGKIWAP
eukprot:COSAG02_NODE_65_length_42645_cov_26.951934_18_plen_88_part_00